MIYVALLRGINVGGNKKVEMTKLKKLFECLGFQHVRTYINSGNIIFETNRKDEQMLVTEIEKSLQKTFGFEIGIVLRDVESIQKICDVVPTTWTNDAKQKTDMLFLWDAFDSKDSLKQIGTNPEVDILKYIPGAIVWNMQKSDYSKSGMHAFIGSKIYKHMTARNINTVRKLYKRMIG